MPNANKTALLVGASGLVGGYCLEYLLAEPAYEKVIVLVRTSLLIKHPKLEQHVIEFDKLGEYQHLIKAEHIYCCLGTTVLKSPKKSDFLKVDFTYPVTVAKIAKANGASQYSVISALSADPKSLLFYSRVKGELENAIIALGFNSVQIFRPSYLVGKRQEFRPIERMGVGVLKLLSPLLIGPLRKFRAIDAKAVAYAMVKQSVAEQPGVNIWRSDNIPPTPLQRGNKQ